MDGGRQMLRVLDSLGQEDFRLFKWHLGRKYSKIPDYKLEKADRAEVTNLIERHYPDQVLEVAINVLTDINRMDLVAHLEAAGGQCSAPPPSNPAASNSGSVTSEKHFVDQYRQELIKRVSNINPILDELLDQNIIKQEAYDKIISLPTTQEKVRELYCGPLKAGDASKDKFYKSLVENESWLIDDLKKKK